MNRLEFGAHHLGLTRRTFLKSSGAAVASASLSGAWLSACGDGAGSSSAPWWLQGNYAPVKKEIDATDLEVRGAIPSALDGLYVRNGSNPVNGDSAHWFLGDGMLHSLRLSGGNAVAYRNRWVRTGVFDNGGVLSGAPVGGNNQSNVSAIYHGGRLITSGEVGLPYEVNPGDLSTIGVHDFDGGLTQSFTAHPKIDPATGYLHFFGYWFLGQDLLLYHVADETGQLISTERVDVDRTTMIHSFAITEQDVVFWESPVCSTWRRPSMATRSRSYGMGNLRRGSGSCPWVGPHRTSGGSRWIPSTSFTRSTHTAPATMSSSMSAGTQTCSTTRI